MAATTTNDAATTSAAPRPVPRLKERYRSEIHGALLAEFGYPNVMQVPTVTKIVVNMGVGEAARDAKLIDGAVRDLTIITGQKPAVARAMYVMYAPCFPGAAMVLASWLGFAMGSGTSRALSAPVPSNDASFLPELFEPGGGFLRDLGEILRT